MSTPPTAQEARMPFGEMPFTAAQHLRLSLYGVIARVLEACTDGDIAAALQAHPFVEDYVQEIHGRTGAIESLSAEWRHAVEGWEGEATRHTHLPLIALRRAGFSALEVELLLAVGLVEEDPRFATVFESAQGGERRPTFGLLMAWWRAGNADDDGDDDRMDDVRRGLQRLIEHGLVALRNPESPRTEWVPTPVLPVWDALRGESPSVRWLRHTRHSQLPHLEEYIAAGSTRAVCTSLTAMFGARPAPVLQLRGPLHNGRKTLAGALARSAGKSIALVQEALFEDEARWRLFGALAAMLNAVPVLELDLTLGEARSLPPLPVTDAPLIIVSGRHGAWSIRDARPLLTIDVALPGADERQAHWEACLPPDVVAELPPSAFHIRLSSGHIRAVAAGAVGLARLAGRRTPEREDLRLACRALQPARLETIATRLEARGHLNALAVDPSTREELDALLARCRWRERLAAESFDAGAGGVGVRAMLAGPSGSGKTLAARLLASELGKDLYRVDLAATVNKYLGETEKNLHRALSAAEELDVVLLIDEGDALMASRTDVGSSNDRYANLETNFLLQRIESFEGIVLVTTNAPDRIDRAFARRMDVVVNFRSPDAARRFEILKLHLAGADVDDRWLEDAASRCALSGGQLRNVVSHARLLALEAGQPLDQDLLYAAFAREYRRNGATCPLRPPSRDAVPAMTIAFVGRSSHS